MMIKFKFFVLFLIIPPSLFSQSFSPLEWGVKHYDVFRMYYDTTINVLYAGGSFEFASGVTVNSIAQWNGTHWDSLGSGVLSGSLQQVRAITKYNNQIYAGGSFSQIGGVAANGLARWDGINWHPFASTYGCVFNFLTSSNDLYVMGCFDTINNMTAYGIAKYDGTNWTTYPPLDVGMAYVSDAIIYNNDLFIGGEFNGPNYPFIQLSAMVRWDGSQWQKVGTGFNDANDVVSSFVIYQGELYAGGWFFTATGSPGNCIAKWNGTSWSQCGSGVFHNVFDLAVYNGELYAAGQLTNAGGNPVVTIAKWDGNQWYAVPGGVINGTAECFAVGNGDLYIGGGFADISGDTTMKNITKYNFPTDINEISIAGINVSVYPNPGTGELIVKSSNFKIDRIEIDNALGKKIYEQTINYDHQTLNTKLNAGIYFVKLFAGEKSYCRKIIVE